MVEQTRRLVIMGAPEVGKSSLVHQYMTPTNVFNSNYYYPTVEDEAQHAIEVDGVKYHLEILDTAGQHEYTVISNKVTMNTDGYILVYAVNSRSSFELVSVIYDKVKNARGTENIPMVLVGNKCDLPREVSQEEGDRLARDELHCPHVVTSVKDDVGIDTVFKVIIDKANAYLHFPDEAEASNQYCTIS